MANGSQIIVAILFGLFMAVICSTVRYLIWLLALFIVGIIQIITRDIEDQELIMAHLSMEALPMGRIVAIPKNNVLISFLDEKANENLDQAHAIAAEVEVEVTDLEEEDLANNN